MKMPSLFKRPPEIAGAMRDRKAKALHDWQQFVEQSIAGEGIDLDALGSAGDVLRLSDTASAFANDADAVEAVRRLDADEQIALEEQKVLLKRRAEIMRVIDAKREEIASMERELNLFILAAEGVSSIRKARRAAMEQSPRMFAAKLANEDRPAGMPPLSEEELVAAAMATPVASSGEAEWVDD